MPVCYTSAAQTPLPIDRTTMSTDEKHRHYWRTNVKVLSALLCVWFLFSCVLPIFLVDELNKVTFAGFKLGFWIAQQGSIVVFIFLILGYAIIMRKVDAAHGVDEHGKLIGGSPDKAGSDAAQVETGGQS